MRNLALPTLAWLLATLTVHIAAAAIVTTPGSVLTVDNGPAGSSNRSLVSYNTAGASTGSLSITNTDNFGYRGLAIIGTNVYLGGGGGGIYQVDTTTGAVTLLFNSGLGSGGGQEALGNHGSNVVAYNYTIGTYREFTTGGTQVLQFTLGAQGTGLDVVGNEIYLAKDQGSNAGDVEVYDATTGALLRVVQTNIAANVMAGLGYDALNNQFLIVTDDGSDRLLRYNFSGTTATLVQSTPVSGSLVWGLDVFDSPSAAVPEPASLAIFAGLACVALSYARLRRNGRD